MSNLNKTYHKGKYRSGEWAKHLRPYLKRLGNKRFRKDAKEIKQEEILRHKKYKRRTRKSRIMAKITVSWFGDSKYTYRKSYRSMRDLQNAVKRPNVIRYIILEK